MAGRAELKNIAREWILLWSTPVNWVAFDRLHADDFEDCSPGGRGRAKDDFAGGLAELVWAFPDLKTCVGDLVVDQTAGKVAVRWSGVGTNRDVYLGIGPTERKTPLTGIEIIEIRDGRIVRRWGEWDITAHQ